MDACESRKHTAVDTVRPPLVPAERNSNAATTTSRRPRTREISSRYKFPTPPPSPSVSRRSPSPSLSRLLPTSSQVLAKRSLSAERRRPSTPPSPPSPSTPIKDSSVDPSSRRLSNGARLHESLWPSTMRSLSVSFQSDSISVPVSKKEKPVSNVFSDRTLRPSSNVAHKQGEVPARSRKPTPERKRSPLKGKNAQDQSENAKPVDSSHSRLIDQHRWPSRIGGKISVNPLNRSPDLADMTARASVTSIGTGLSSQRRTPVSDGTAKPLQKSNSDAAKLSSLEEFGRVGSNVNSVDDSSLRVPGVRKHLSGRLSEKLSVSVPAVKFPSIPSPQSRPASPNRSSIIRGVSPSRASTPSTPPSRGVSPSRIRPSSAASQSTSTTSVLSFIADYKKGKKGTNYIENAHQIRLLHNRFLQWRFANARAEAVLYTQKVYAERILYSVWNTTLDLWDSVIRKRINLQQLKLELKLNAILNDQMAYLDNWALLERDHISSVTRAVEDLEASTLRLPVAGGAKLDIESFKVGICSAVDVMQAMGSSICSLLSRVEGMNCLISELATVAAQEKAMLDECEALLASVAALQVEEYSIRTHFLQVKQALEMRSMFDNRTSWP